MMRPGTESVGRRDPSSSEWTSRRPPMLSRSLDIIRTIDREGITILTVEQNANMALSIADRAYVCRPAGSC
jgi:ABC-type branched-subunit amino acid transport system ATPase component